MKNPITVVLLALLLILSALLSSCSEKNSDEDEPRCKIIGLGIHNTDNFGDTTNINSDSLLFTYNSNQKLEGWRSVTDIERLEIMYNSNGNVERANFYANGELVNYEIYNKENNEITITFFWKNYDGTFIQNNNKVILEIDPSGEIVKTKEYYERDTEWIETSYTVNTWENRNLVKEEYYYAIIDYKKKESNKYQTILLKNAPTFNPKIPIEQLLPTIKSNEFILIGNATFVYDNLNNPFGQRKELRYILRNGMMVSSNNLLKQTTNFIMAEETFSLTAIYNYEYNNFEFPVKMNTEINIDDMSMKIKWNYEYECN